MPISPYWQIVMRMPYSEAISMMGADMPAPLKASNNFETDFLDTDLTLEGNTGPVLQAENIQFIGNNRSICVNRLWVTPGQIGQKFYSRGNGLGTIFMKNLFNLAKANEMPTIVMEAGSENGPLFSAMHGFGMWDSQMAKESGLLDKLKENLEKLGSQGALSKQTIATATKFITQGEEGDRLFACKIAHIAQPVGHTTAGKMLMQDAPNYLGYIDLNCPKTAPFIKYTEKRARHYANTIKG